MAIIGIFFGSDTGNTENIAKMIQKQLGKDVADVHDIAKSSKEDLQGHDILLLGIPTWYYGEAQCDWDDSSRRWKRLTSTVSWSPCLAAVTRKTMLNTSVMRWEPSATSSNRAVQHRRPLANGGLPFRSL
ncbi:Flavodoxin-1 [Raoultella terrigena]|uniref:Flavodoxin-1 n=1 Tax=Raoultella terrigena TaxID=577 RepID=A0A4U9DBK7_RAOTE|nr:Flavodoxin-1 [Raoultella terrigena]